MKKIPEFKKEGDTIDISVFPQCSNNCVFCTNRPSEIKEHDIAGIKAFIKKAGKSGKKNMELSAMEPTLYPHLADVVLTAKKAGFERIHLVTNGQRFNDDKFLKKIVAAGVNKITVSLHSADERTETKITSNPTNFKNKVASIKNIVAMQNYTGGPDLYVNTVINKLNYRSLKDITKLLAQLGVKKHNIYFPHIAGNALKNFDSVVPKYSAVKKYIREAVAESKKLGLATAVVGFPACIVPNDFFMDDSKDNFAAVSSAGPAGTKKALKQVFRQERIKRAQCDECVFIDSCAGVSKEYIKRIGWDEFRPVASIAKKDNKIKIAGNKKEVAVNIPSEKHWIRLTTVCNQKCMFCLDSECQDGNYLPMANIMADIKNGVKRGAKRAVLSGGEASIHPKFFEIIKNAKQAGYTHIQVITNGQKFADPDFFEKTIKAGVNELTFSIHGHTSKLHDKLTGVKGSFINAVRALKNSKKYPGLIVSIDVCINGLNYKFLPEIVKTFTGLGFYEFDLLAVVPFGRAWDNKDSMMFDLKKAVPYLYRTFDMMRGNKGLRIWTNRLPAEYLEGYESLIQPPDKLLDEVYGRKNMFADLLQKGDLPDCHGTRCRYCFISGFCADAQILSSGGILYSLSGPKCLDLVIKKNKMQLPDILTDKNIDFKKFIDFYIKNRYFVKSAACRKCKKNGHCNGAPISAIIKNGFSILKPFK
jgi:MoaA/NifB/PqqE/SkfB family radical SAM enzyme